MLTVIAPVDECNHAWTCMSTNNRTHINNAKIRTGKTFRNCFSQFVRCFRRIAMTNDN